MTDAGGHPVFEYEVSASDPPTGVPVEVLRSGLKSDDNIVRAQAASLASTLPTSEWETLAALAPTLADRLRDERGTVAFHAAVALSLVAEERPDRLEPAVPGLVSLLDHDLSLVRSAAARALGLIADARPSLLSPHVGALLEAAGREPADVLDPDDIERAAFAYDRASKYHAVNHQERQQQTRVRAVLGALLVDVAEHDPDAVRPHLEALLDLAVDDDAVVSADCVLAVGLLARDDPAATADAVEPLCGLLDRADDGLVATAVATLGFLGDPAAVGPLRALADGHGRERDTALRDLARETAAHLAED